MPEYIERKAALQEIRCCLIRKPELTDIISVTLELASNKVSKIPAADVEPVRHGRWIQDYVADADPHERIRYKCSLCGRYEEYREPYCNCGAKMDMKE